MVPEELIKLMKKDPLFSFHALSPQLDVTTDEYFMKSWFWSCILTVLNEQAIQFYSEYADMDKISIYKCTDVYNYYSRIKNDGIIIDGELTFYHSMTILEYMTNRSITLYPQPHTIAYHMDLSTFIRSYFPSLIDPIINSGRKIYTEHVSFESYFKLWITNLIDPGVITRYLLCEQKKKPSKLSITTYENNSFKLTKIQQQVIVNFLSHRTLVNGSLDETDSYLLIAYINEDIYYLP